MLTLIEILKKSEEYLLKHGVPEPRRNSELIAGHVLGKSRLQLYVEYDKPLSEEEVKKMRAAIIERKARKPVQYIFGETDFYGLPFSVNPGVLIPRPETELLVDEALKATKELASEKPVIYDIGTGCGCIAVSIAKQCDKCFIYASDISAEALKTASANAAMNGVADKMQFLLGPVFRPFAGVAAPKANIVVSNPPYIRACDMDLLEPEVRSYEPRNALDGGPDGLDVIRRIIADFPDNADRKATLLFEIGFGQSNSVMELINADKRMRLGRIVKDYREIDRIIIVQLNN